MLEETIARFRDTFCPVSLKKYREMLEQNRLTELTNRVYFLARYYKTFDTDTLVDRKRKRDARFGHTLSPEDAKAYAEEINAAKADMDSFVRSEFRRGLDKIDRWKKKTFGSQEELKNYEEDKQVFWQQQYLLELSYKNGLETDEEILSAPPEKLDEVASNLDELRIRREREEYGYILDDAGNVIGYDANRNIHAEHEEKSSENSHSK